MSPGRKAPPPTAFSLAATTASVRSGSPSSAIAPMPSSTAPPPAMSPFMSSMYSAGLIEIPPVSKVIALPTSPSTTSAFGEGGS